MVNRCMASTDMQVGDSSGFPAGLAWRSVLDVVISVPSAFVQRSGGIILYSGMLYGCRQKH